MFPLHIIPFLPLLPWHSLSHHQLSALVCLSSLMLLLHVTPKSPYYSYSLDTNSSSAIPIAMSFPFFLMLIPLFLPVTFNPWIHSLTIRYPHCHVSRLLRVSRLSFYMFLLFSLLLIPLTLTHHQLSPRPYLTPSPLCSSYMSLLSSLLLLFPWHSITIRYPHHNVSLLIPDTPLT